MSWTTSRACWSTSAAGWSGLPGGVGKSRLATALAERLQTSFIDGLFVVDLAPLRGD